MDQCVLFAANLLDIMTAFENMKCPVTKRLLVVVHGV